MSAPVWVSAPVPSLGTDAGADTGTKPRHQHRPRLQYQRQPRAQWVPPRPKPPLSRAPHPCRHPGVSAPQVAGWGWGRGCLSLTPLPGCAAGTPLLPPANTRWYQRSVNPGPWGEHPGHPHWDPHPSQRWRGDSHVGMHSVWGDPRFGDLPRPHLNPGTLWSNRTRAWCWWETREKHYGPAVTETSWEKLLRQLGAPWSVWVGHGGGGPLCRTWTGTGPASGQRGWWDEKG